LHQPSRVSQWRERTRAQHGRQDRQTGEQLLFALYSVVTNWYLLEEDERLTIVDTGVPTSWESLHSALGQLGRRRDQIEAVVLTHAHFDHVSRARAAGPS